MSNNTIDQIGSAWNNNMSVPLKLPDEIGIFVRSREQFDRAQSAMDAIDVPAVFLDDSLKPEPGHLAICTMHLAKGLEFRAVAVMACDDEVIPLQSRIESVTDTGDLEDVYNTERHLLYVACTRTRANLLVTGVDPDSEFLNDMTAANTMRTGR